MTVARPTDTAPVNRDADSRSGATLGELVGDVTRDLSTLLRQELALARAELRQEAVTTGKAAGSLGAAGFAGCMVALFVSIALWRGMANVMDESWAALLVAVLWAAAAALLYSIGRQKLRDLRRPERTLDTLRTVPDALQGQRGGTP